MVEQVIDGHRLARQRFAELNAPAWFDHARQDLASLVQRHVAQIVAIEVQKVESDEIEIMLPAGDRFAQLGEIGQAFIVDYNKLAVDDRALGAKVRRLFDQIAILRCPVMAVAGVDPGFVFVDYELRAIAVELTS